MSIKNLEHFFKPEIRNGGQRLFSEEKISINTPSDTEVLGYIKNTQRFKISLKSSSLNSSILIVMCNCPAATKGQFCKHIWGTLFTINNRTSDFLNGKSTIEIVSKKSSSQITRGTQTESQIAFKARQNEYRKKMYQEQKKRLKDKKKSPSKKSPSIPLDVENALRYFSENGFPLEAPFKSDDVSHARKKLSRIFHPDIGGTHDEILILNKNFEILIAFIENDNS